MNFYISDLHLGHKNVTAEGTNFDGRPYANLAEMHEDIKRRWNKRVTNADTVYILGDAVWNVNDETIALMAQLRGHKVLVCGNHDQFRDYRYARLFDEICDYKEMSDNIHGINHQLILSHYPILMWKKMQHGWIHLYGHCHNTYDYEFYHKALLDLNAWYAVRDGDKHKDFLAVNVGAMMPYMDYTPRTLSEIIDSNVN